MSFDAFARISGLVVLSVTAVTACLTDFGGYRLGGSNAHNDAGSADGAPQKEGSAGGGSGTGAGANSGGAPGTGGVGSGGRVNDGGGAGGVLVTGGGTSESGGGGITSGGNGGIAGAGGVATGGAGGGGGSAGSGGAAGTTGDAGSCPYPVSSSPSPACAACLVLQCPTFWSTCQTTPACDPARECVTCNCRNFLSGGACAINHCKNEIANDTGFTHRNLIDCACYPGVCDTVCVGFLPC